MSSPKIMEVTLPGMSAYRTVNNALLQGVPHAVGARLSGSVAKAYYSTLGRSVLKTMNRTIAVSLSENSNIAKRVALDSVQSIWRRKWEQKFIMECSDEQLAAVVAEASHEGPRFFHTYSELLTDYLGYDAPIIIATAHVGPYQLAMQYLSHYAPSRDVFIITKNESSDDQMYTYGRVPGDQSVSTGTLGNNPGYEGVRKLRAGHTIVIFFDTPPPWGAKETTGVRFFGQRCAFSTATAKMALYGRAAIIPVLAGWSDDTGLRVQIGLPIGSANVRDRSRWVEDVTQELASMLERWIRKYPGEWPMWSKLPSMWMETRA